MEPRPDDIDDLLIHEPYVRALARKLVLDGVRADDVVQQTWLAALCADRTGIASVRGWLAAIVRRVAATARRAEARAERRERLAAQPEAVAAADDARSREGARRAVVDAVFALDEPWRTTLVLRHLEGVPQREIARRMGVPVETVHSRLRRGLELLRQRLDAGHDGDRRAWLLGLIPFAAQPGTVSVALWSTAAIHGVLVMLVQFKAVVVAAAVAAVGLFWFATTEPSRVDPSVTQERLHATQRTSVAADDDAARADADDARRALVAGTQDRAGIVEGAPLAGTGSIEVSVRTREPWTGAPIVVQVSPTKSTLSRPPRMPAVAGQARFDGLDPGTYAVSTDRFVETTCVVEAGVSVHVTLDTTSGYRIAGRVVDPDGGGVEGATISLSRFGRWQEGFDVAVSGANGAYTVEGVGIGAHVGASKSGFAASPLRFVFANPGELRGDIDLELRQSGGSIAGRVTDARGEPLADARIVVDADGILSETHDDGTPHLNVFERFAWSAGDGAFRVDGLLAGSHKVVVRASGFQPFIATCETRSGETTRLDASLRPGAILVGSVRNADGTPAPAIAVTAGRDALFSESSTATTTTDGSFRLESLPAGRLVVFADDETHGAARVEFDAIAGVERRVDLELERPPGIAGRVEDENGQGLAGARLDARRVEDRSVIASTTTAADGTFRLRCGKPTAVDVDVSWVGSFVQPALRAREVRVGDEAVILRVPSRTRPSARIVGRIVDARGPVAGAEALILAADGPQGTVVVSAGDGSFRSPLLSPASYHLQIRGTAHAVQTIRGIVLDVNATHDVGTIRLGPGGSLRVRLRTPVELAGASSSVWLERVDDGSSVFVDRENDVGTASKVAPGRYVLSVAGEDVLARSTTVEIHDGEETSVDVAIARAVTKVRFVVLAPTVDAETVRFRVDDGSGQRVHAGSAWRASRTDAFEHRIGLAPGAHRVTVVGPGELSVVREFEVAADVDAMTVELSLP